MLRLFNRTSRSIRLTAAGEHLLRRVGPALGDLAEAIAQVGLFRDTPAGTLRLNVPRNANEIVVRPMLARFLAAYPEITLDIVSEDGLVDTVAEGFDAGIRVGESLGQDMIRVPVGPPLRFAVVGSPAYLVDREPPRVRPTSRPTPASVGAIPAEPATLGCLPATATRSTCPSLAH